MRLKPESVRRSGPIPQRTVLRTDQIENTYWLDFSMQFGISESPSPFPPPQPLHPHPPPPTHTLFEISESSPSLSSFMTGKSLSREIA